MLELTTQGLKQSAWEALNISLPGFDIDAMKKKTLNEPVWVHFGAGNIFRAFIAALQNKLLGDGLTDRGIIVAETFDFEIIQKIYDPHDNLALLVGLRPDGSTENKIIASVAAAYGTDESGLDMLRKLFTAPSLQMASFTITEKGYALTGVDGKLTAAAEWDIINGPKKALQAMSQTTALILERYKAGAYPLALVCMDNFSGNGDRLKAAVMTVAKGWFENGHVDQGFIDYLNDINRVSFPWTMIDKITPRPSESIEKQLFETGLCLPPIITAKGTYIAPFVNAEIPEYLVVEDNFPAGRPLLEKAGVYFTDRDTVNKTERMKVTVCLNPLHTALAVFGCLLGFTSIAAEMKDPDLTALVEKIGYAEGLPVVPDPGLFNPVDFLNEALKERLPNPYIPDTPQRIVSDTSQKMPIRFGETIKSYIERSDLTPDSLIYIPLTIAAWFRYLLGLDDELNEMTLSYDPLLTYLTTLMDGIEADQPDSYNGQLRDILKNADLFGTDLTQLTMARRIEEYFVEMLKGKGSVRRLLHKMVG